MEQTTVYERNTALLERVRDGDASAEAELVEENLALVRYLVKRFVGRGWLLISWVLFCPQSRYALCGSSVLSVRPAPQKPRPSFQKVERPRGPKQSNPNRPVQATTSPVIN